MRLFNELNNDVYCTTIVLSMTKMTFPLTSVQRKFLHLPFYLGCVCCFASYDFRHVIQHSLFGHVLLPCVLQRHYILYAVCTHSRIRSELPFILLNYLIQKKTTF